MSQRALIFAVFVWAVWGCSFSPATSGSLIDCSDGKECPEGWHCPATGKKVCVQGTAGTDGGPGEDGGPVTGDGGTAGGDSSDRSDTSDPPDQGFEDGGAPDTGKTCLDECPAAGTIECSGAYAYHVCGDPDSDGCLEWGSEQECAAGCSGGACGSCTPDCTAKDCGDDGCQGSCGQCNAPPQPKCDDARTLRTWDPAGTCNSDVCSYTSSTKDCPYGCGNGACVDCTPDCGGKECGDNGCGELCGECNSAPTNYCLDGSRLRSYAPVGDCASGKCSYTYNDITCQYGCAGAACQSCSPSCGGKECGGDGCGGSCGSCGPNQNCSGTGQCRCNSGYDDCDGNAGNGCETNLNTSAGDCGWCGNDCDRGNYCERATCSGANCSYSPANEGRSCGSEGNCHVCRGGSCECNTPHYECPSCLPSCGVLKGHCCPDTTHCDAAGEKGQSHDCFLCCAGQCEV